ncbi:MAG: hypothetical protein ABI376_00035, partial [Caulobacteraceae bacterium]
PLARRRSRGRGAGLLCHQTRDKAAALKFIKKAMKRNGSAKAIVTDNMASGSASRYSQKCPTPKSPSANS